MNFNTFKTNLTTLETGISITSPAVISVKRAYWGAPPQQINELPAVINALTESSRILGFGSRDQGVRINVQLLAARTNIEDERSSAIATALWFAAKDAFDKDFTIGGAVSFATLIGADPTVPVLLQHSGLSFIGFNAYLDIKDFEKFVF
jgi:hypothetical protein